MNMQRFSTMLGLFITVLVYANPSEVAASQSLDPVGQWSCEYGYQDRHGSHTAQYAVTLYPNQSFEAQGQTHTSTGSYTANAQGQWHLSGATISLSGSQQSQLSGDGTFALGGDFETPNAFSNRIETQYNRYVSGCQRLA